MKRSFCVALVATLSLVAACGDDDGAAPTTGDEVTPSDESTTTAPDESGESGDEGEQAAGDGDFCTGYQELLAGEPTPEALRTLVDVAPESAKEPLEAIATGFEDQGEAFFGSTEFTDAFSALGAAAGDECADETIEVAAVDYAFDGLPAELSAGTVNIALTNEGQEMHEMIVFRKNDGVTQSFDELLAGDQEAAMAAVSQRGVGFAAPGQTSGALIDMSEPGEYVAVCFIPVGTTPDAEGSGPPHFVEGMKTEFTVTDG